jgi:5'-nucleotidase
VSGSRTRIALTGAVLVVASGCRAPRAEPRPAAGEELTLTVLATNDLHGNLERLPLLAGFVDIVRDERRADGGALVVLDAGDMLHGTLESNLNEGAAVIRAYDAIGYDAVAIGNHDFDFGPLGPDAEPLHGDDAHGALKRRAAEASFPVLCANVVERATGRPLAWPNVRPSVVLAAGPLRIGVIGVATEALPWLVRAANFAALRVTPLVEAVEREARLLRLRGVQVVIVLAHAGGRCANLDEPQDLSSCDLEDGEVFRAARALTPGLVDAIVAGHNHSGVAHVVAGIPIVESFSHGYAFGRIDLRVDGAGVHAAHVYAPRPLCETVGHPLRCDPGRYEGEVVRPDPAIAALLSADMSAARILNEEALGVEVVTPVWRSQTAESPLGNLLADLMLASGPAADMVIQNGGALRRDISVGPLTYGELYRAMSFDNHFALIRAPAGQIAGDLAAYAAATGDLFSVAGARVALGCAEGRPTARIERDDRALPPDQLVTVLTSDYLATGGDGMFSAETLRTATVSFPVGPMIRDAMARELRRRGGELRGDAPALYDPGQPRVRVVEAGAPRCEQP